MSGEGPVRRDLTPHPATPGGAASGLSASVALACNGASSFVYRLRGDLDAIAIPAPREAARTDGLWKATCFEAFVRTGGEAYCEFNFSPSGEWAAYRFERYRAGMKEAVGIERIEIECRRRGRSLELRALVDPVWLRSLLPDGPILVALSAIIEERSGRKSYWALRHPTGKPDFHHPDCFTLEIARNGSP